MHRSFGTALLAAVLTSSAFGIAAAASDPLTHSLTAGQIVATAENVEPASAASDASAQSPVAPAQPPVSAAEPQDSAAPVQDEAAAVRQAAAEVAHWTPTHASALSPAAQADAIRRFARGIVKRTSSIALSLTRSAMRFVGTPYVFGGTSPAGFDCSGYVQHVFAMLGVPLPRTADAQYYAGHRTVGGMRTGDLVFFETYLPGPSHVGIYIGSGKFIHSSGHGVMVSRLRDRYWSARYLGAKRVVALR